MKISTNQYFNMLTRYMGNQQGKIAELQAKLATGDNMVKPSAEPDLAARSLQLQSTLNRSEFCRQNLQPVALCLLGLAPFVAFDHEL